jgi:hypothetical protein
MVRLLVWWSALALHGGTSAGQVPLACDEESELMRNVKFIRTVCSQAHETFVDSYTYTPSSCHTATCKIAVDRVSRDCGELVQRSGFFSGRRKELAAAVSLCATAPAPAELHVVVDDDGSATSDIVSCAGTLSDGAGEYGKSWRWRTAFTPWGEIVLQYWVEDRPS